MTQSIKLMDLDVKLWHQQSHKCLTQLAVGARNCSERRKKVGFSNEIVMGARKTLDIHSLKLRSEQN